MFDGHTTFILGAGASRPYGFPLGEGLIDSIAGQGNVNDMLRKSGFSQEAFSTFSSRLRDSHYDTIDEFLRHNPEDWRIGTHAIAAALLHAENSMNYGPKEDHWYKYLWNSVAGGGRGLEGPRNWHVAFLTYNYDRSLEAFMTRSVANAFRVLPEAAWEQFRRVQVVHLHGSLAPFNKDSRFGADFTSHHVAEAAKGILIPCQKECESEALKAAQDILSLTDRVIFLGFGYHDELLRRLDIQRFEGRIGEIHGTGYMLRQKQIAAARAHMPTIEIHEMRSRELLETKLQL